MKLQYLGLIGLGLICAFCAALLVAFNKVEPKAGVSEDVELVVAARDIAPMTSITEEMCEVRKVQRGQAPKSTLAALPAVVGHVTTTRLVKGQPFTEAMFAPEGSGFFVASNLPAGKRAVNVALADYSVLDGLLYPGCAVDVIASFDMRSKGEMNQGVISKTLLHNVQVLAVENRTVATPKDEPQPAGVRADMNRRRVTLLVDPDQAEMLSLAQNFGTVSLAMRGPTDTGAPKEKVTRLADLGLPPELTEALDPSTKVAVAPSR
jgi:pilus assembly protein CpaB